MEVELHVEVEVELEVEGEVVVLHACQPASLFQPEHRPLPLM